MRGRGFWALVVLAVAVVGAGGVWLAAGRGATKPPAVVATFDDAAYLVPGQDVRIAGANAGTVRSVHLGAGRKAIVAMDVDAAYVPFRRDARCTIRPQSLIGERYVDCSPGTPSAPPLARDRAGSQELPLSRTGAPIDLDLVLDTLDRPVSQRLALIVTELGTGLSGRSDDLAAAIHRANPALDDANRLLDVLDHDRRRIGRLVTATDAVLAGVAARHAAVPRFIRRADGALSVTAARRRELAATVRRLPALLRTGRGTLQQLRGAAQDALPVVRDLHAAAPAVNATVGALGAVARTGPPAVTALGRAATELRPAVQALRPVAAQARPFAALAQPAGALLAGLTTSLQERGATRGIQTFLMNAALATSRYDAISHVLTATQLTTSCSLYARTPDPACSAHFAAGKAAAERVTARRQAAGGDHPAPRPRPLSGLVARPPATGRVPLVPRPSATQPLPVLRLPGLPPITLPGLTPPAGRQDPSIGSLLGYLLG